MSGTELTALLLLLCVGLLALLIFGGFALRAVWRRLLEAAEAAYYIIYGERK